MDHLRQPEPERRIWGRANRGEITHWISATGAFTECCGRTPFELPRTDRLTLDRSKQSCAGQSEGNRSDVMAGWVLLIVMLAGVIIYLTLFWEQFAELMRHALH